MLPCVGYPRNASNAITSKFIRQATNKIKCPVFVVLVSDLPFFSHKQFSVYKNQLEEYESETENP